MTNVYALREARIQFGPLAERAAHGETIILTKHGRHYAQLTPIPGNESGRTRNEMEEHGTVRDGTARALHEVFGIEAVSADKMNEFLDALENRGVSLTTWRLGAS
jgi:prevent-host-death family protein